MAERANPSGILIGAVALVMLCGGAFVVVQHYQTRKAQREQQKALTSLADEWVQARVCLTNGPAGDEVDPSRLLPRMSRRRDRSMALDPASARYPYVCFQRTRAALDALREIDEGLAFDSAPYAVQSSPAPFSTHRLMDLAEMVVYTERGIDGLWERAGGEGSPYPDHIERLPIWDEEVLPAFPVSDECPPTAVTLEIGVEEPRAASVSVFGRVATAGRHTLTVQATSSMGQLTLAGQGPAPTTLDLDLNETIVRVRACAGGPADAHGIHVLAGTATKVVWAKLDRGLGLTSRTVVGDEALAEAFRGEDGREVHLSCDGLGISLAYASDEGARLFVCGEGEGDARCESPEPLPIGSPRMGLARIDGTTVMLSYPPDSRVSVVDAYDGAARVGERRVVPTVDDRANPELLVVGSTFALRLCGRDLVASPDELEWAPAER